MTRRIWTGLVIGLALAPAMAFGQAPAGQPATPPRPPLTLTTTAFPDGGVIPNKYTQAAEQVSPALAWTNVPAGADAWATRTAVYNAMQGHILGKAVYVGLFRRPSGR
jgi:phosphatidylethanolamine-binding protein (PEBP) family uncharacterized protein